MMQLSLLKSSKIYLASPYSDPAPHVSQQRFQSVAVFAGILAVEGYTFISPITHSHPIAYYAFLDGSYDFWKRLDEAFMDWSDVMVILGIYGWKESNGISQEYDYMLHDLKETWLWLPWESEQQITRVWKDENKMLCSNYERSI